MEDYVPIPTGFHPLDEYLEGGLHADDLWLLGGIQNIGKTVAAVQMARNIATSGAALPVVVCYEHSPLFILHRLLCLESIDPTRERVSGGLTSGALNAAVVHALRRGQELSVQGLLSEMPEVEAAWGKIESYLDSMWLVLGDGRKTTVDVLELYVKLARERGYGRVVLFVDYLQIVPVRPSLSGERYDEYQRIGVVMKALKTIALEHHVPVVAVSAADEAALRQQRVHLENLLGPALVQYQPDGALILNRSDEAMGERESWPVRWAVEKNRHGVSEVEVEMVLHGPYYAFNPLGRRVSGSDSYQHERVRLHQHED
jgi:replicative DNA helicase